MKVNVVFWNDVTVSQYTLFFFLFLPQKLTTDMDKVLQEKASLEAQLVEENRHTTATDKHTEQDWKILESRLKVECHWTVRSIEQVSRASWFLYPFEVYHLSVQSYILCLKEILNFNKWPKCTQYKQTLQGKIWKRGGVVRYNHDKLYLFNV